MNLAIQTIEGERRLTASDTPWALKDALKAIEGRLWSPEHRAWHYPMTSKHVALLKAMMPKATMTPEVEALIEPKAPRQVLDYTQFEDVPDAVTTPWGHQKAAYWFAREKKHCLINYGMGSGKSKVVIDLVNSHEKRAPRILITCPLAVVEHWVSDWEKHGRKPYRIVPLGRKMSVAKKLKAAQAEEWEDRPLITVINHESLWRHPFGAWALAQWWDMVVVDESHRAKAPGGKFSMYLRRLRADMRICTTGTPMPHSPLDLYAQARFIDSQHFGTSFARFRRRYAIMGGYQDHQVVGYQNHEEFAEVMDRFTITVASEDVLDLPDTQHIQRYCVLDGKEKQAYAQMERDLIAEIDGGVVTAANAMVKVLRLAQITSGYVTVDQEVSSGKKTLPDMRGANGVSLPIKSEAMPEMLPRVEKEGPQEVLCMREEDRAKEQQRALQRTLSRHPKEEIQEMRGGGVPPGGLMQGALLNPLPQKEAQGESGTSPLTQSQSNMEERHERVPPKISETGGRNNSANEAAPLADGTAPREKAEAHRNSPSHQRDSRRQQTREPRTMGEESPIRTEGAGYSKMGSGRVQKGTSGNPNMRQIGTSKQDLLQDTLDGLALDEPVVVFCRFHADLDAVHTVCAKNGRMSHELSGRRNELSEWQNGPTASVLAVQLQSGGVGVDLTRARYCIYYAVSYSLGDYEQSLKRLHRPGQTRKTIYYHLLAKGTVDETIYKALESKGDVIDSVLTHLTVKGA